MKCFVGIGLAASGSLAFLGILTRAANFDATSESVGYHGRGFETPVNQWVTPVGKFIQLPGVRPNALVLSPDGRLLVTAGLEPDLLVLDPATGKIRQRVPMPPDDKISPTGPVSSGILHPNSKGKLSFTGLVFSPNGRWIYLSNVNGDIKVFSVSRDDKVSPLFSIPLPPASTPGRKSALPTGIAVSPDGKRIYVALNVANRLAELDAATGRLLRTWNVGVAPYDVVLCRKKIFVSNWGGRRPGPHSVVGPIGETGVVRVDSRGIASEGSVSVIIPSRPGSNEQKEILTGRHACALALSPSGKFLVCANAGDDTLSVIDTRTDKIAETINARQQPGDPFGAQPNALAFGPRGKRLFVCNGTQNAVAVIQFKRGTRRLGLFPVFHYLRGQTKMIGLIPVGWFPCSIAYDARRGMLYVANIKSVSPRMEKANWRLGHGYGFNTLQFYGSLSLVPVPSGAMLSKDTETALADLRYPLLARAALPARSDQLPRPVPERAGEPSVFKHVIYIIKENRTYDQVLGDGKKGNGDPTLCVFGKGVTPNEHKIVRDFVQLDNLYCCSILSADGHEWADTGIATDYLEREFAGWPRSYPDMMSPNDYDAVAYSPAGFLWNDTVEHGKTFRDYGEGTYEKVAWRSPDDKKPITWLNSYRDFVNHTHLIHYSSIPGISWLARYAMTNDMVGWDLSVPDVYRAAVFIRELKRFEAEGKMPNLIVMDLPDDHTAGTSSRYPTPAAMVADNDLAFGEIVDAVSHSSFWTNTCIFACEDDPQDGWDHVSGYRTTAYVISPYTKRHAVVDTQYNQTSILRTIELILGLPPMNQMDATATPMFDCFTDTANFAPYVTVTNQVPLDQMNPPPQAIANPVLRRDALISAKLPLDKADQCPENLLNHIIWRAVKGTEVPYPNWAVKAEANDD